EAKLKLLRVVDEVDGDTGEDHQAAAKREFEEETGGLIKLRGDGCIATTEGFHGCLCQLSYCYCADLVDGSGQPNLTEEEVDNGLRHLWVSVEEAKKLMAAARPTSDFGDRSGRGISTCWMRRPRDSQRTPQANLSVWAR
ncbi:hypothetical protein C8A03DRAFT_39330, partial [Achaetomium macrosporum]